MGFGVFVGRSRRECLRAECRPSPDHMRHAAPARTNRMPRLQRLRLRIVRPLTNQCNVANGGAARPSLARQQTRSKGGRLPEMGRRHYRGGIRKVSAGCLRDIDPKANPRDVVRNGRINKEGDRRPARQLDGLHQHRFGAAQPAMPSCLICNHNRILADAFGKKSARPPFKKFNRG